MAVTKKVVSKKAPKKSKEELKAQKDFDNHQKKCKKNEEIVGAFDKEFCELCKKHNVAAVVSAEFKKAHIFAHVSNCSNEVTIQGLVRLLTKKI